MRRRQVRLEGGPTKAGGSGRPAATTSDFDSVAQLESPPRGLHAMQCEPRGAHVMRGHVLTDEPHGAHVNPSDPFRSVEQRALHAVQIEPLERHEAVAVPAGGALAGATVPKATRGSRRKVGPTTGRGSMSTKRRRWRVVPVVGAAGGLALGLGGGAAFAFVSDNSANNDTSTVSAVTVKAVGTTGTADLLPGRAGAISFTLDNTNPFGLTFDQIAPGATVVSDNPGLCNSDFVSIAPVLPFALSTPVTVSPDATSGTQSIPDLVQLASDAPSTCQGVTFTVSFTLSGQSS